jgi:hypothetical protein
MKPLRCRYSTLIVLALCCLANQLSAQPAKPARPATAPSADVSDAIIPELSMQGVKLGDAVEFLQDAVPGFKAVVFRDPGVSEDVPTVTMRLKRVSISQLLQLLTTAHPNLEVNEIPGAGGTVYCIKVHSPEGVVGPVGPVNPGLGGGVGGFGVQPSTPAVKVFALASVVDAISWRQQGDAPKDKAATSKAALNEVLSLIKATLEQVDAASAPVLQLHEETQTLIFKGTAAQREGVENVLTALTASQRQSEAKQQLRKVQDDFTTAENQWRADAQRANQHLNEMQRKIDELTANLRKRDDENLKLTTELERAKVRLEEKDASEKRAAERGAAKP